MKVQVLRYCKVGGDPDRLSVIVDGISVLDVQMGLSSPFRPRTSDEAKRRPWFYTGSPFGLEILSLAEELGLFNLTTHPQGVKL